MTEGMYAWQKVCVHDRGYVHVAEGMCTWQRVCARGRGYVHVVAGMCAWQRVCVRDRVGMRVRDRRYVCVRVTEGTCA